MDTMKIDPETIRQLRDDRAWSQEHLAAVTGLSLRTIQRAESEGNASAETRMSLATAFDVDLAQLNPPITSNAPAAPSPPGLSPSAGSPPDPRQPGPLLSYFQYRLVRLVVVLGLLVWLDIHQTGTITWSKWVLVFGAAWLALRILRARFVAPRPPRRGRSAERNV